MEDGKRVSREWFVHSLPAVVCAIVTTNQVLAGPAANTADDSRLRLERLRHLIHDHQVGSPILETERGTPQFTRAWELSPGNFDAVDLNALTTREAFLDRNGCFVFAQNQPDGPNANTVLVQSLGTIPDTFSDLLMDPPGSGDVVPAWSGQADGVLPTNLERQGRIAIDPDGFIYIHTASGEEPNQTGMLTMMTPDGSVIRDVTTGPLGAVNWANVLVGADGVPIVIRSDSIQARTPFFLAFQWIVDVVADYPGVSSIDPNGYAVDRSGDIFVKADTNEILRISGQDGSLLARSAASSTVSTDASVTSELLIGRQDSLWSYSHDFDPSSSSPLRIMRWNNDLEALAPNVLEVVFSGGSYVLDAVVNESNDLLVLMGRDVDRIPVLVRIPEHLPPTRGGRPVGFSNGSLDDFVPGIDSVGVEHAELEIGPDGSVYIWSLGGGPLQPTGPYPRFERLTKHDPDTLAIQRDIVIDHGDLFQQTSSSFRGFAVDGGDNIFTWFAGTGAGATPNFKTAKYTQPTPDRKTFACDERELSVVDQSIWAPGTGRLEAGDLFWSYQDDTLQFGDTGFFTLPFLGRFGGGMDFSFGFAVDLGWGAEIEGGSVDVNLPFMLEWEIPPQDDMPAGSGVTLKAPSLEYGETARMTTCFTPTFNAGLTGGYETDLLFEMEFEAFSKTVIDETFLDDERMVPTDYIPYLNTQDLLADTYIDSSGEWYELKALDLPLIASSGRARTPKIEIQSSLVNGAFDTGEQFVPTFELDVNVTRALTQWFFADDFTNPFNNQGKLAKGPFEFDWCWRALQFLLQTQMGPTQTLRMEDLMVEIDYEFSDGLATQSGLSPDDPLTFTMPPDGEVVITPTVRINTTFQNDTGFFVGPRLAWEIFALDTAASIEQFNVWDTSFCFQCNDVALGGPFDFGIYDTTFPVDFGTVSLEPITVTGRGSDRPVLSGSSRDNLPVSFYNQRDPSSLAFLFSTDGDTRMLLHGDEFRLPASGGTTAWISHMGRTEQLDVEQVFNDRTMCVLVPNRFRIIPGIAKIWVETANGPSRTLDLPIVFPKPLIETVNPNLWAADPDMLDLPIQVIDKKSPLGSDTFIARRDYFIKLRDELWSNAVLSGLHPSDLAAADTNGDGAVGVDEYFPHFDFNQVPPFPAVLFDGVPLPRFIQPTDSGIHNARITRNDYDETGFVPVSLCNPGPGGGMSRTLYLNIAAPPPQVAEVSPSTMEPGGEYFPGTTRPEIIVTGPKHVITDPGFEEPKFSNFNASSVVLFDGTPVETEFLHSGALRAFLPVALVQHPRQAEITVYTPSNGSVYFDELYSDTDGDTLPDDLVYQGLVDSGGESFPVPFSIEWRVPVLSTVSPSSAERGSPAFADSPSAPEYNITLLGESFRQGAVVLFDGQPRATEFASRNLLRARLLPADLAVLGEHQIQVMNPGSGSDTTDPIPFHVDRERGYQLQVPNE